MPRTRTPGTLILACKRRARARRGAPDGVEDGGAAQQEHDDGVSDDDKLEETLKPKVALPNPSTSTTASLFRACAFLGLD